MLEQIFLVEVVFNIDKGLVVKVDKIPVLKDTKEALVLDNDDFETIYKNKKERYYKVLGRVDELSFTSDLVGYKGYFETEEQGRKDLVKGVKVYLESRILEFNKYLDKFIESSTELRRGKK